MSTALESPVSIAAKRLAFIDNIRWVLIVLVICHHAAVTYSHVGSWYFNSAHKPGLLGTISFATFEEFNQAYFMGLLFLIAGYFVPRAYDQKGFSRFLRDRFIRLVIPSLCFMFVLHPFLVYGLLHTFANPEIPPLVAAYGSFFASGRFLSASGPMWFALALFIFSCSYGLYRLSGRRFRLVLSDEVPGAVAAIALASVITLCTFLVRTVFPIGFSIGNMQLCFFSQYVLLFCVGILAFRGNWLLRIPYSFRILWFRCGLLTGIPAWFLMLGATGVLRGNLDSITGGWRWQSLVFALWESFFCVAVSLGLLVWFRDRFNRADRFSSWLSRNSFGAYFIHPPLLVAITLLLEPQPFGIGIKFAVACLFAVPISFLAGAAIRSWVPGLGRIL